MQAREMLGIVLCAGLGTRLRPLTSAIPKPAVPVGPVPAALRNIEQLLAAGLQVVHCNTHYLANELEAELRAACRSRALPDSVIRFWNEPEILETGGGIARIVHAMASENGTMSDALVVSGDIVADIPLTQMLAAWHRKTAQQTTLMVSLPLDRPRKDVTWVNEKEKLVCGFGADAEPLTAQRRGWTARVFSNHQIISNAVLSRSRQEKRSSIDLFYRSALAQGEQIIHVPFEENATWFDIGTPETYLQCINTLDQKIPEKLKSIGLSKINLCLPDYSNAHAENAGAISHEHDQQRLGMKNFVQSCLIMTEQFSHWTWLGSLHSLPPTLELGLSRIIAHWNGAGSAGLTENATTSISFTFEDLDGYFLTRDLPSSASSHLSGSRVGFIHIPLAYPLSSSPLLRTPLLVPLDLLTGAGSHAHFQLAESASPFWVLFTQ